MLESFVNLASRAIRLDFLKPRVYENDFSKVQAERDGKLTVYNTRYKTRIRNSTQVRYR